MDDYIALDNPKLSKVKEPVCRNVSLVVNGYLPQMQDQLSYQAQTKFEMWLEEYLFLLVLYKGMKTKLGLKRSLQKNFNKRPTCCCPSKKSWDVGLDFSSSQY